MGRDAGPPGFEGVKPGTHQVDDAVDGADEAVEAVAKLSVKGESAPLLAVHGHTLTAFTIHVLNRALHRSARIKAQRRRNSSNCARTGSGAALILRAS